MNNHIIQKRLKLKQKKIDAGFVSEVYPKVSTMVFQMTYYQKRSKGVLMERTLNVFPDSYAYFHMQCMVKGCEEGGFDMAPIIAGLIKRKKTKVSGKLTCGGAGADLPDAHASITYEVAVKYTK